MRSDLQPLVLPLEPEIVPMQSDPLTLANPPFFLSIEGGVLNFNTLRPVVVEVRMEGIPHYGATAYSGEVGVFVLLCSLLVLIGYQGLAKQLSASVKELLQTKERSSLFTEVEGRPWVLGVLLQLQTLLQMTYLSIWHFSPRGSEALFSLKLWGFYGGVLLLFFLGERLLNFALISTFSSARRWQLWQRGRDLSFELLGVLLLGATLSVTYGDMGEVGSNLLLISLFSLYLLMLLVRGVKIFFKTMFSYVYLILYLCTAIWVPILLLYHLLGAIFNYI